MFLLLVFEPVALLDPLVVHLLLDLQNGQLDVPLKHRRELTTPKVNWRSVLVGA